MTLAEEMVKFRFKKQLDIRWSDMDAIGHVNNAVYLTYFEQARVYYFDESCQWDWQKTGVILANCHIDFIRPVVFPNPTHIYVRTSKLGNKSFELQYLMTSEVNGKEEITTTGNTVMVMFNYSTNQSFVMPDFLRERLKNYEPVKL